MRKCTKCGAVLDAGERCECGGSSTQSMNRIRAVKEKSRLERETEKLVSRAREAYLRGY